MVEWGVGVKKRCSKCGEEKELGKFYEAKDHKDGHQGVCKKCFILRAIIWRKVNKQKHKEYVKIWRNNNFEKYKKSNNQYLIRWRKNNRKKWIAYCRKWKTNNPLKILEQKRRVVDSLAGSYIKHLLKMNGFEINQITPQMIQLKREQVMFSRVLRQLKRAVNESN